MYATGKKAITSPSTRTVTRGNTASADYSSGTLTKDGAWHDLDLSSVVPTEARWVQLQVNISAAAIGRYLLLREKDFAEQYVIHKLYTHAAAFPTDARFWIGINSSGILEYAAAAAAFTDLNITVVAWDIPV